jgi:hypothetical protein
MTFTQIPQRLEIAFWATVIPIMKDSSVIGDLIAKVYTLVEIVRELKVWQQLALLAITGLLVGFTIGLIKAGSW